MTTTDTPVCDNGVNVQALLDARSALTDAPEAAQFTWRATHRVGERHPQPTRRSSSFFGLGGEQAHKTDLHLRRRPPRGVRLRGQRRHPGRVRAGRPGQLPHRRASPPSPRTATSSCGSVKATIEGDMDVLGILGIDPEVRNGFSGIRVNYDIDADATAEDIEALVAQSQKRSAVYDVVTNPTNVTVDGQLTAPRRAHAAVATHGGHRRRPRRPGDEPLPHRARRSTTSSSSGARSPTRGRPSAGTRCGSSRRTGRRRLPGLAYDGDDPDGFMTMPEVVGFIDRYAAVRRRAGRTRHHRARRCDAADGGYDGGDRPGHLAGADGGAGQRRLQPWPSVPDVAADVPGRDRPW